MQENAKKVMFIAGYYITLGVLVHIQIILLFSVITKNAQDAFQRELKRMCKIGTKYRFG